MEFLVEDYGSNDITVAKIVGKVSSTSVMELKKNINNLLKENKIKIILDLTELTFINSMGLGTIVNALKKVKKIKGDLKIVVTDEKIKFLFEILNLKNILKLYDTREDAAKDFV